MHGHGGRGLGGELTFSRLLVATTFVIRMSWPVSGAEKHTCSVAGVPVEDDHALSDFMTIEHDDVEDRAEKDASSPSRSRYFPRAIAKRPRGSFRVF